MTRFILLAALGVALAGGRASAGDCDGSCEKYGWHPLLKIRNWFGKKDKCGGCGKHGPRLGGHSGYGSGAGFGGLPGDHMPGTLVFPNHPYARSPRDFFMYEPK